MSETKRTGETYQIDRYDSIIAVETARLGGINAMVKLKNTLPPSDLAEQLGLEPYKLVKLRAPKKPATKVINPPQSAIAVIQNAEGQIHQITSSYLDPEVTNNQV